MRNQRTTRSCARVGDRSVDPSAWVEYLRRSPTSDDRRRRPSPRRYHERRRSSLQSPSVVAYWSSLAGHSATRRRRRGSVRRGSLAPASPAASPSNGWPTSGSAAALCSACRRSVETVRQHDRLPRSAGRSRHPVTTCPCCIVMPISTSWLVTHHCRSPERSADRASPVAPGKLVARDEREQVVQLGMIGLGRMGANLVRRLMRDGHDVRRLRRDTRRGAAARGRGRHRRVRRSRSSSPQLSKPRARLDHGAGGVRRRHHRRAARRTSTRATSSSTAATPTTATTSTAPARLKPDGHPLRRRRHERRRVRARAGLLPHDRRGRRRRRAPRPDLRHHRARGRRRRARPGRTGDPSSRRARVPPLRTERRRPLREDGPQRHRVRDHGRVRRGPQHPARTPNAGTQQRTEDAETAPLREPQYYQYDLDIPERRRGVATRAASSPVGCSTSPPTRCRRNGDLSDFEGRVSDSRRGSVDGPRRDRRGRPGRRAERRALRAVHVARPGRLRRPAPVGDAQGVRRPRREARPDDRGEQRDQARPFRRVRLLRDVGRPRPQEDLPRALLDGEEGRCSTSR